MSDRFDIEYFPTSPSAIRMMSRISPIYEKSYVGKWIFEVMGLEIDDVRLRFGELKAQAFPETATWGLPYWEQRYGITPKPGDNLEARRRAVITKRDQRAPMNPRRVEIIVEGMTGKHTTVTENVADYTFSVTLEDVAGDVDIEALIEHLKRIKPSHQNFIIDLLERPEETTLTITGSTASFSVTELPEWRMDYNFKQTVTAAGLFASISTTELPPAE